MRVIDRICDALAIFAGVYLVAIMIAIVFQATARTLGFSGSSHVFTFTEYGLLYIVMAGSPWLVRVKGHVFIEMFTAAIPAPMAPTVSRAISLLSAVICLVLFWYTLKTTIVAFERGDADMRSVDMPKWLLLGTMPICFGLMTVQFLRFVFGPDTMHTGQAGVHE